MAEDTGGLPDSQQQQQAAEANDGADHVRQVGSEIVGCRPLAEHVADRPDNGQRPTVLEPFLASHEVNQHPWWQQG